jgi:hypothetical protein
VAVSQSVARGKPVLVPDVTGHVLSDEDDLAVPAGRRNGVKLLSA